MATQIGLNAETLKTISDEELRHLLRSTGGRDLDKVRAELKRRKNRARGETV